MRRAPKLIKYQYSRISTYRSFPTQATVVICLFLCERSSPCVRRHDVFQAWKCGVSPDVICVDKRSVRLLGKQSLKSVEERGIPENVSIAGSARPAHKYVAEL